MLNYTLGQETQATRQLINETQAAYNAHISGKFSFFHRIGFNDGYRLNQQADPKGSLLSRWEDWQIADYNEGFKAGREAKTGTKV